MDKNRFETQKEVVNLDPTLHNIPLFFTVEDLKWLIEQAEKVERIERESDQIILEKTDIILELERLLEKERNMIDYLVKRLEKADGNSQIEKKL